MCLAYSPLLSSLHNCSVLPSGQPETVGNVQLSCTREGGKRKSSLFSSLYPCGSIPNPDGTFSSCRQQHSCQQWCTSQRSRFWLLSLHSSGSERSYLRALIYGCLFCFVFLFDLYLEPCHLCGCLEESHPWSSCSERFKWTLVY